MTDLEVSVSPEPKLRVEKGVPPSAALRVLAAAPPQIVQVRVPGPQGEKGSPGVSPVGGSDAHLAVPQSIPQTTWTVTHNLGKHPAVQVFDSAGTQVEGDVTHVNTSTLTVEFAYPFSGVVYLN